MHPANRFNYIATKRMTPSAATTTQKMPIGNGKTDEAEVSLSDIIGRHSATKSWQPDFTTAVVLHVLHCFWGHI